MEEQFTENTIYAIVSVGGKHKELHFFELPPFGRVNGVNNTYRSYSAFRQRMRRAFSAQLAKSQKAGNGWQLPATFKSVRTNWAEVDAVFAMELPLMFADLPRFKHANLAEFYHAIRYDIKRKRFLKDDEDFKP